MHPAISIQPEKCTGCGLCVDMCASRTSSELDIRNSCIRIMRNEAAGMFLPLVCRQCSKHPCVVECPVEAIIWDGVSRIFRVNNALCIACGACQDVCPYEGAFVSDTAHKCDLCGGNPQCVPVCLPEAISFSGIPSDPLSEEEWTRIRDAVREGRHE